MTESKYAALARQLEKDILTGKYGMEGGLPSVKELADKWDMSINTVKAAMSHLEGKKLIEKRGNSYYVCLLPYQMTQYVSPIDVRMKAQDRDGYIRNIGNVERVKLPEYLADKAHSKVVDAVLQVCVLGELTGEGGQNPTQMSYYYFILPVPDEMVGRMQKEAKVDPLQEASFDGLLTRRDEITSRLPTQDEAKTLNLSENASAIACTSIVRDPDNNLLLIQQDIFSSRTVFIYSYQFTNRP